MAMYETEIRHGIHNPPAQSSIEQPFRPPLLRERIAANASHDLAAVATMTTQILRVASRGVREVAQTVRGDLHAVWTFSLEPDIDHMADYEEAIRLNPGMPEADQFALMLAYGLQPQQPTESPAVEAAAQEFSRDPGDKPGNRRTTYRSH